MNKNYRKKIYAETIAEQVGISTSYLSHLFKSETGKSLQEYIIEVRIERAKEPALLFRRNSCEYCIICEFPITELFW